MTQSRPYISQDPLYLLLRNEEVEEFNKRRAAGEDCDFKNLDFRGCDLRGINADDLDLSGSYFRSADLRGIDLRKTKLEGISIANAKISGTYFPSNISPQEILMSLEHGSRIRCDLK